MNQPWPISAMDSCRSANGAHFACMNPFALFSPGAYQQVPQDRGTTEVLADEEPSNE
jgi:hypothetical protein